MNKSLNQLTQFVKTCTELELLACIELLGIELWKIELNLENGSILPSPQLDAYLTDLYSATIEITAEVSRFGVTDKAYEHWRDWQRESFKQLPQNEQEAILEKINLALDKESET